MAFDFNLKGKIALVTGASSGLGEHFARVLAGQGVHIGLAARSVDKLEALAKELSGLGVRAAAVKMDVTDVASIRAGVDAIEAKLGPIDTLVNNSGVSTTTKVIDVEEADYDFTLDTNAKGAFFVAQAVARKMIAGKRRGKIINVASVVAMKNISLLATYGMSKAAVTRMTQSMALEFLRYDINVNAICPGYILTGINSDYFASPAGQKLMDRLPKKRVGPPESLDGALLLLASEKSDYINGALIPVDDGTIIT
jgi:NAD(P)-dependent dehydrogenase (short-subunit alcohol dehydrogenase family)